MTRDISPGPDQPPEKDSEPGPGSGEAQEQSRVEVKDSRGVIVGNYARLIINGIDEKVFQRFGLGVNLGFGLLSLLVLSTAGVIISLLLPKHSTMKQAGCELCIAIAAFTEDASSAEKGIGTEFGATLANRLQNNLAEIEDRSEMTIGVWGPQEVGSLKGKTIEELDRAAPEMAEAAGIDILVYGLIKASGDRWEVIPRFYISPDFLFQETPEIVGQDQLGTPFDVADRPISSRKRVMNDRASSNGRLLAALATGMTYYSTHDYDSALKIFETASAKFEESSADVETTGPVVESWQDPAAVRLLYLMMGNCLLMQAERNPGQTELLDLARQNFNAARGPDDSYARAFLGLGSVAYLEALTPAIASGNPVDTDLTLLENSEAHYGQAVSLVPSPDPAHVREKAHTYLGRVFLARAYAESASKGLPPDLGAAADEFSLVIQSYTESQNENSQDNILQELAAEAHAGLALIAHLEGRTADSIREYQAAVDLTDNPVRKEKYRQAITDQQSTDP